MNNEFTKFDDPISTPDSDLLKVELYARKLAAFIKRAQPPFTLGIYGEWGAGKTSFVRLIQHFLLLDGLRNKIDLLNIRPSKPIPDSVIEDLMILNTLNQEQKNKQQNILKERLTNAFSLSKGDSESIFKTIEKTPVQFIYFSAWPYTTSDTIWKALVLEITKSLYSTLSSQKEPAKPTSKTLIQKLRDFLSSDMLVIRKEDVVKDPLEDYKSILSSLDQTAYGSISKDTKLQYQFNHEIALTSIVEGALKAIGSISPLVRLFQGLFGIEFKSEFSEAFQKEKNEATRKIVESINEFRKLLLRIFEEREDPVPIYIFVDDLDRCLPDVALDILEAIKIFLNEIPCVFIVAADDNLIGQGLRLRYKELFGNVDQAKMDNFLAVKGQEYFEKIIQFGIKVPSKTITQTHQFIAAQFPRLMPVTDIIQTAVGTNPRRLKQYCNRLAYNYMVHQLKSEQSHPEINQQAKEEALYKMVQLYAWLPECAKKIGKKAESLDATAFKQEMSELEEWLKKITPENIQDEAEPPSCKDICSLVSDSAPLVRVFTERPLLSELNAIWIATFARLADIKPKQEGKLYTDDSTFMRIYETSKIAFSSKKMMIDNLARLTDFFSWDMNSFIPKDLYFKLAESGVWLEGMKKLEEVFEKPAAFLNGKLESENFPFEINEIITKIKNLQNDADKDLFLKLREQFTKSPKLSTIQCQEVLYFKEAFEKGLPDIKDLLSLEFQNTTGEDTKTYKISEQLFNDWNDDRKDLILESLELRNFAVQHFQQLRSISKLDGLEYKWPELTQLTRINGRLFLKDLEAGPQDESFNTHPSKQLYLDDDALRRFLAIQPLFRDIPETSFNQYLDVSQISARAILVEEQQQTALQTKTNYLPIDKKPFKSLVISIEKKKVAGTVTDHSHSISMKFDNEAVVQDDVNIDIQSIKGKLTQTYLEKRPAALVATRGIGASSTSMSYEDFGKKLPEMLFGKGVLYEYFNRKMNSNDKIRLIIQLENNWKDREEEKSSGNIDNSLFLIPFELLYLEQDRSFVSITQRISVLRYSQPVKRNDYVREFDLPVRILVAIARPNDVPYLEFDQEKNIILDTLKEAISNRMVEVHIVDNASKEKLQRAFRFFEPHIFHYIGHGVSEALALENEETGKHELFDSAQLGQLLDSYKINIAVLNACNTANAKLDETTISIAEKLVEKGIPAVIACNNAIADIAALQFTKEFYQAMLDGFSLETAMSEARKALWFEKLGWHQYVLFASTTNLDNFRLKILSKRESEPTSVAM